MRHRWAGHIPQRSVALATSATSAESPPPAGVLAHPAPVAQPQEGEPARPALDPAAFHGIAGRVVATLGPHTEADPAGLLLTFLAAAGNVIGPGPRALVGAAEHPARLSVLPVGETARARKGTAQAEVSKVMAQADPGWFETQVMGGLASGEGLIYAVRDGDPEEDGSPSDKRIFVVESEFARVLAVAAREGNTLSAILRQAWDGGRLRTMTRRDPLRASGAHITVVGHITTEELLRRLGDTEIANGFANRFLFALVRRSRKLPEGGSLDPAILDDLGRQVAAAIGRAQRVGILTRSPEARERWAKAGTASTATYCSTTCRVRALQWRRGPEGQEAGRRLQAWLESDEVQAWKAAYADLDGTPEHRAKVAQARARIEQARKTGQACAVCARDLGTGLVFLRSVPTGETTSITSDTERRTAPVCPDCLCPDHRPFLCERCYSAGGRWDWDPVWRRTLYLPRRYCPEAGQHHRNLYCKHCHPRRWLAARCPGCERTVMVQPHGNRHVWRLSADDTDEAPPTAYCSAALQVAHRPERTATRRLEARAEQGPHQCGGCSEVLDGRRSDARCCSGACRQRAYRRRGGS